MVDSLYDLIERKCSSQGACPPVKSYFSNTLGKVMTAPVLPSSCTTIPSASEYGGSTMTGSTYNLKDFPLLFFDQKFQFV